MFIDEVAIKIEAGKGGDGVVTWRREKYIPKGGPWGGNGGAGGNVYLQTIVNLNTLSDFRHKKVLKANDGQKGGTNLMQGASGEDLIIYVPTGTIVRDLNTKEIIVDLSSNNLKFLLCLGGRGGFGNAHFTTSTRQAPTFAEMGDIGESREVLLELKLVADIGIIGIPSAGKSSLIASITNVKPKIGDYPFTTLIPHLGVLDYKQKSLVLEDVPGLIPGASKGKGLGIEFLKHIERTKVLLHLIDLYRLDKAINDYEDIRFELGEFSKNILKKEEIVVFSKGDLLDKEMKDFIVGEFKKKYSDKKVFVVSSATGEGLEELKDFLVSNYTSIYTDNEEINFINKEDLKIINLKEVSDPKQINLEYLGDYSFRASGKRLEQIVRMTNFSNSEATMRVYDVLDKLGVIKKIEKELKTILKEEDIDNSFFFEGSDDSGFSPKVIVGEQEILLEKLKFNL
ncbi:GTPase ObgE [Candidatus Gracilibacteria bacterium]|nr:GTPase ObgE [Candidatus Gracilibacteria bacterium]